MIVALFGYIATMMAAFVAVVVTWHAVIGPSQMEKVRQPSHPIGAVAAAPDTMPAQPPGQWGPSVVHKADDGADTASADDARAAADKQAAADAEKAKRQRQAYYKKRKEQLARQQQDQQYSTALGYDQERSADQQRSQDSSSGPFFSLFGPRRF
jgi:hypothetical protein